MDDPELHGGERILIRTAKVHVKSISFEAILTNKRIVLIDRVKNILPQKEIPLATIQTVEAGENAIRETVITLTVVTRSAGMRQMVLTFSRESGGNRAKERNEWVRLIKENIDPSFAQVSTVIPGIDPAEKAAPVPPPRFKIIGSAVPQTPAAPYEQATKPQPVKKIVESPSAASRQAPPVPAAAPAAVPTMSSSVTLGTYCTKCGTRVPDGSGFCNRCGSRIIVRGGETCLRSRSPFPRPPHLCRP
ncbi:MAG: zinc ribbon domain-containing protein [Methanoregula sp.]|jgi:DNA-directed RNA polymerase subunit RPC12/RpoP|uniref:zinc ribbon domain-containing protein n=1 Tax=Methanoregula sp. TaxID=2052170 RepID=UPI003D13DDB2